MWSIFSRDPASNFPYEVGEEIVCDDNRTVWKLHRGKKRQNGEEVSVFICDIRDGNTSYLDVAKAAVKKLKTLRHPCILTYIDSLESDKLVYLVTEPVTPLLTWLNDDSLTAAHRATAVSWGLLQVTKGLSFLNNDGNLIHYNVCASSVFVTRAGEWKLGGVEYSSSDSSTFPLKVIPKLDVYNSPEKIDSSKISSKTKWAADVWGLGCLIWEVFNGYLDQSISLRNTSKIPKSLVTTYTRLVGANPAARPNPRDVVSNLHQPGQFFHNDLIETLLFLEEIQIKDANEKHRFFSELTPKLDNIPEYVAKNKVLPALLAAHEFSNVGSVVLSPLFKIGKLLSEAEYQQSILPCVVKLFSSSDRATRLKLLQQIEFLVEHMNLSTVNDQVFPQLATGFLDTNPTIREHTVKSIMFLAPKLNYNNLNVEVLKHFARLQSKDDQGGIRTNTTVCLGKITGYLHPDVRQKCLTSAFTRAMRDPFPPARTAGVMAIAATQQYYPLHEVASKILPSLCQLTLDPEKSVRDSVFRVLKGFLSKLEKVSDDPTLREQIEAEVKSFNSGSTQTASWAGWAVGAITSKFYKSNISVNTQQHQQQQQQQETQLQQQPKPSTSSRSVTPSTKSTSLASTPSQDQSRSSSRTATKLPNDNDESDYEEWENSNWMSVNDSPAVKKNNVIDKPTTVSSALAAADDSMDGGDGWGDEEEWGSLEDGTQLGGNIEDNKLGAAVNAESKSPLSSSFSASLPEDSDDFFNSLISDQGASRGVVSRTSSQVVSPTKTSVKADWDEWGEQDTLVLNNSGMKGDEQRRQREEKKQQRQREIEAKRAARAGPMKLGAKKI
ncbi:N-terminal kinase-like protein isoform X1 [Procambarus clarkii]|uniref:N-terminal kinase-like protein isoform X1 n=1 Tax=Procambarus clarkii TaxID=6728 RepID=UPI001E673D66|nr:N-terminal kinase-like protein isoform X1 [Procambarus clarkii]